jgi:cytochrome c oxidase cbb3-type subunit III
VRHPKTLVLVPCALALGLALAGCPREKRQLHPPPPPSGRPLPLRQVSLQPGSALPADQSAGPYEGNSYAINQGERLYEQYNCVGCHFHGGGGIGPALMDDLWIYGGSGRNIHDTIVEGRPNGMPSYGGHIPDDQIWQIAAYVRTLSGQVEKPARPTRSDELFPHPSEQAMPRRKAKPEKARQPG